MRYIIPLLIILVSAACGTTGDNRYRDNSSLERPPEMVIDKSAVEQTNVAQEQTVVPEEQPIGNEIEPPKRRHHGIGLKSDVYIVEGSKSELMVKRSFDEVWGLLNQAFLRNGIKVSDQDRSKGVYYVRYNSSGFFGKAFSFLGDNKNESTYMLKVEPQDQETLVVVSLAKKEEQTVQIEPKDGIVSIEANNEDSSEQLLELLHNTLEDDVKD
jgi:uncharacterized lipoprotein